MWKITSLSNEYHEGVTLSYPVAQGTNTTKPCPEFLGDVSIHIPYKGEIVFKDIGDAPFGPSTATWGVRIVFGSTQWVYRYEGGGGMGVRIHEDGSFDLEGSGWPVLRIDVQSRP